MAYGQIDSDKINTSVANTSLGAGNATRFKNRIINGDMRVDQRNAGASVSIPAGSQNYTLDRWTMNASQSSKFTIQQNAGSVTPPVGFSNYLGATSSSAYSIGASEFFDIFQPIEGFNFADMGWGTANAKTVTLSFQIRSSLTGTFSGYLINAAGNRCYNFSYTISSANTWTPISITIAGDTTGTWIGSTNGVGIYVVPVSLGAGSSVTTSTTNTWGGNLYRGVTGQVNMVSTNGATVYITGVQLEVGSSATGFEYVDYGTQIRMCQRYYQKIFQYLQGAFYNTTGIVATTLFSVQMRASPTVNMSSGTNLSIDVVGSGPATFTPTFDRQTTNSFRVYGGTSTTSTTGVPINIDSSTIQASAEL